MEIWTARVQVSGLMDKDAPTHDGPSWPRPRAPLRRGYYTFGALLTCLRTRTSLALLTEPSHQLTAPAHELAYHVTPLTFLYSSTHHSL